MKEGYFVNAAFSEGMNLYMISSKNEFSYVYNSFLTVVIRIIVLIYGRSDIINAYQLKDADKLKRYLAKYGLTSTELAIFLDAYESFYEYEQKNKERKIKGKNPYFEQTLKSLIDMFILKKKCVPVIYQEEEEFLDLIYTSHTKNPYRLSYVYLMNYRLDYFEKYYRSKQLEDDITRDLSKTVLTSLEDFNRIKENMKRSYEIDANIEEKPDLFVFQKLSTGNGYVDILLLMSVIVTSISTMVILYFSFI